MVMCYPLATAWALPAGRSSAPRASHVGLGHRFRMEQGAHQLTAVDPAHGFGQRRRDRQYRELRHPLFRPGWEPCWDCGSCRVCRPRRQGAGWRSWRKFRACRQLGLERALCSRKCRSGCRIDPPFTISSSRTMTSRSRTSPINVEIYHAYRSGVSWRPRPSARRAAWRRGKHPSHFPGRARPPRRCCVAAPEMPRERLERVDVIDRDAEETVDLRGMEGHREDAIGARGDQEVRHQAPSDRDARRVLLVGSRVDEVGNHGGDSRG